MSNIIQGDNNTVLHFTVKDDSGVVDLTNASTITFRMKKSRSTYSEHQATVVDGINGVCEVSLLNTDTDQSGNFYFQVTVEFHDGSVFSSEKGILTIDSKL